ncbi:hypothetical protein C6Y10_12520 [Lactiplantibacillus pentosus]|uniref:hypothetical protein n=1 Tax=Lactiplantibacillus pentosus TaxID=1589 RepID=UPI000D01A946|nr:hypothetical protein [Lactiplantibacillus pentosus]PRO82481.1 hypothetical protein C6Y10_12520 [Lactiplantibacillus pentosus]
MDEMVTKPETYREWADLLKQFKQRGNDQATLAAAKNGTLVWQEGVASRFVQRVVDTINARIESASHTFQQQMTHAGASEAAIIKALHQLKQEYQKLIQLATIPAIPEETQQKLLKLIDDNRKTLQNNLETSAKSDRSGKLVSLVKNNRVDR